MTRDGTRGGSLGPRLAVMGAALLFSTGGAAVKATTLDAWQVTGLRCAVAGVTLAILVPGAFRSFSRRTVLVGFAYAATMLLYVTANKLTTAANAIFLQATAPLYVLVLSPRLLGERVRRSDVAWMALIAAALALIFIGDQEPYATAPDPALGNLLGALSGLTWACTILGLRWLGSLELRKAGDLQGRPGAAAALAGNLIAFLGCLPFALPIEGAGGGDWLTIGYLGVFQVGIAYVLLTHGIERVPALEASLLLLLEPAVSPLWAWLFHGEVPGAFAWVGGVLILTATTGKAITAERRRRRGERALPPERAEMS